MLPEYIQEQLLFVMAILSHVVVAAAPLSVSQCFRHDEASMVDLSRRSLVQPFEGSTRCVFVLARAYCLNLHVVPWWCHMQPGQDRDL